MFKILVPVFFGFLISVSVYAIDETYVIEKPTIESLWANSDLKGTEKVKEFIKDVAVLNDFNVDEVFLTLLKESSFNLKAKGDFKNGRYTSLGLWQLNDVHGLSDKCRFDPVCSTKFSVDLWNKNPLSWTCLAELRGVYKTNFCGYKTIKIKDINFASNKY